MSTVSYYMCVHALLNEYCVILYVCAYTLIVCETRAHTHKSEPHTQKMAKFDTHHVMRV